MKSIEDQFAHIIPLLILLRNEVTNRLPFQVKSVNRSVSLVRGDFLNGNLTNSKLIVKPIDKNRTSIAKN